MMLVENESRSDIDAASLAKVCNKGEKLNANQLARKLLQGGGTRPSWGITKCPKCGHGNMDEPPENKAARRAIRKLTKQWSEDRQSIDDFLGGNSDVCLPVDSKGRQITDPKKIGNPSKLPKELVVVSCILYHHYHASNVKTNDTSSYVSVTAGNLSTRLLQVDTIAPNVMMDLVRPADAPVVSLLTSQSILRSLHTSKSRGVLLNRRRKKLRKQQWTS